MKNVIIFGEKGSGKSSIVNLILGGTPSTPAETSDQAVGYTFSFSPCTSSRDYVLYDTVGLSEREPGTLTRLEFTKTLWNLGKLSKSLEDGISLFILVLKKDGVNVSTQSNYRLFAHVIGKSKVPVLFVITGCEMEPQVGTWWTENKRHFDGYNMNFVDVISGCAADPEVFTAPLLRSHITELRAVTKSKLEKSMDSNALGQPWKVEGNLLQKVDPSAVRKELFCVNGTDFFRE